MESQPRSKKFTKRQALLAIACLLTVLSYALSETAPTSQPSATTKVVFTRPFQGGVKRVVKSTDLAVTSELQRSLGGWLQSDFVPRVFTFEFHLPDGTIFPACSLPLGDFNRVPPADRWRIIDATRFDGWIIFAAYENPYIMMVRYNMDTGETERNNLGNGAWNNSSVHIKLSGTVKLSLSKNNAGLCTVEVIYEREGLRRISPLSSRRSYSPATP